MRIRETIDRFRDSRGIALITTLLVMMLISAVLLGFTAAVMGDQRYRFIDRDRVQAFYGATSGMEKMTADLGNLFFGFIAPTNAQVTALTTTTPSIGGITYTAINAPTALPVSSMVNGCVSPKSVKLVGGNGYAISFCGSATGNPTVVTPFSPIKTGPYEGLVAETTPYQIDVTAKTTTGGEVHLARTIESVAIPVFQFGMFSDVDLAFNAGDDFNFGGRVHTNRNLFLAEAAGATLTLNSKVTAVGEIVRQVLSNGVSIDTSGHTGVVNLAKAPGIFRNLARTEGSVTLGPTSAHNEPTWTTISVSTYNNYIRNGRTGAKALNLPLVTVGGINPDLVRRPPVGEDVTANVLFNERLMTKASLRILLSDTANSITTLPTMTAQPPVSLDGDWRAVAPNNGTPYGPVGPGFAPVARSMAPLAAAVTTTAATAAGAVTISVNAVPAMFLKPQITVKNAAGTTIVGPFICTTWTETQFQGCAVPAALTSGWTIYVSNPVGTATLGPGNMPGNANPSVTLNGAVAAGAGRTLSLAAGQRTWAFAANSFFLNDVGAGGTNSSTMVTCSGATALQFTGCVGVPATRIGASVITGYDSALNTGTLGGFIKAELQYADNTWHDVTMELLNYGIAGPNLGGIACADPTPNAIIRLERLRDNGGTAGCPISDLTNSYEYWPNTLFDPREGLQRDTDPATVRIPLGGVMHYVMIDATNLARWFRAAAPYAAGTGGSGKTDNGGFTVYFSDRRNNRNATSQETGEYGWEDFVNPASATGVPNNALDAGEDVNANSTLDVYGGVPNYNGVYNTAPPGAVAPLTTAATPTTTLLAGEAQVNRAILFRRALKLWNGATLSATGITGLTIVTENPAYVQGNWNAQATFLVTDPHIASAVICDAITLLSNSWIDNSSYRWPFDTTTGATQRLRAANTYFRMGVIAGKGAIFPNPAGTGATFGTDGGAHAFMRFLEGVGPNPDAVHYRGSMATFFYNRQAVGTFKCCNTVYSVPTLRDYIFDTDFQNPALLPPNTPVFRDMNTVGFSQEIRPGK